MNNSNHPANSSQLEANRVSLSNLREMMSRTIAMEISRAPPGPVEMYAAIRRALDFLDVH